MSALKVRITSGAVRFRETSTVSAWRVNSSATVLTPLGLDVFIGRYDGRGGNVFDHVGAGVNTDIGDTEGFYVDLDEASDYLDLITGELLPGEFRKDDPERLIDGILIPTTPEQDRAFEQVLEGYRSGDYGSYDLYEHNCVSTVLRALSAAGITCPDAIGPPIPDTLMENLLSKRCQGQ